MQKRTRMPMLSITAEDVALLRRMRARQRDFYASRPRSQQILRECLYLEREVDKALAKFPDADELSLFNQAPVQEGVF